MKTFVIISIVLSYLTPFGQKKDSLIIGNHIFSSSLIFNICVQIILIMSIKHWNTLTNRLIYKLN